MRTVYVLKMGPSHAGKIVAIADDPERLNMALADYTAFTQSFMVIEEHDVLEDGD